MANNRLWLVHKPTGARVLLGKYYPSCGWDASHDRTHRSFFDQEMSLYEAVDAVIRSEESRTTSGSANNFKLEYEG